MEELQVFLVLFFLVSVVFIPASISARFVKKELVYVKHVESDEHASRHPSEMLLSIHREATDDALLQLILREYTGSNSNDIWKTNRNSHKHEHIPVSTINESVVKDIKMYRAENSTVDVTMQKAKDSNSILLRGQFCINGSLFHIEPVDENINEPRTHHIYLLSDGYTSCLETKSEYSDEGKYVDNNDVLDADDLFHDTNEYESENVDDNNGILFEPEYNIERNDKSESEEENFHFVLFDAFNNKPTHALERVKRAANPLTIEILFVIDNAAYNWWKSLTTGEPIDADSEAMDLIRQYYAYIFEGIDERFSGITRQNFTIDLAFSGLFVAKSDEESYWTTKSIINGDGESARVMVNSSEALDKFQKWIDGSDFLPKFDHAILFTGTNLTYAGSPGNTGLAFASSMCRNISNSSIVEDTFDLRTVTYASQQIARSLGTRDDMDNNDCLEFLSYIMAPKFKLPIRSFATNRWFFSTCSKQYLNEYILDLNKNGLTCLQETSLEERYPNALLDLIQELPGFVYSGKRQCEHRFGLESDVCREEIGTSYSKICTGLLCTVPGFNRCEYILPADGTPCGNKKYCKQGSCSKFEDGKESVDTCAFGNDKSIGCETLVTDEPFRCYEDDIRYKCCETCHKYKTEIPNCEYGDRILECSIRECIYGDPTYATDTCCLTCADGPTPYAPPLENTMTENSSQGSSTMSTLDHDPFLFAFTTNESPTFSQNIPLSTPASTSQQTTPSVPTSTLLSVSGVTEVTEDQSETTASSASNEPSLPASSTSISSTSTSFINQNLITNASKFTSKDIQSSSDTMTTRLKEYTAETILTKYLASSSLSFSATTSATPRVNDSSVFLKGMASIDALKTTDRAVSIVPDISSSTTEIVKICGEKLNCTCLTNGNDHSVANMRTTPAPSSKTNCTSKDNTSINQMLLDKMLLKDLAISMQSSQRFIKKGLHQNIRSMYLTISGQLRGQQREYENENEGSEAPSYEDDDVNRKLKPIWRQYYIEMMRDLEQNVREMRYRILAMLSRHFRYKSNIFW